MPGMSCMEWPDAGALWSPVCGAWAARARLWRDRSVRVSRPRVCGRGRVRVAGAEGLAGLSAPKGGGGLLAQPPKRPKARKETNKDRAI
jgi:hypothetical protein